jgi:hypothetical protein
MGPPQAGGGIGTLGLVGPWAGYRVLKKKRGKETIIKCSSMYKINLSYGEGKSWYKVGDTAEVRISSHGPLANAR